MMLLDAFLHWLHLMAAIIWIGGMIFAAIILQPVMRKSLTPEVRMPIYHDIGKRFKLIQLICLGVLIGTGLQKLWSLRTTPDIFYSTFGAILGVKLTLVICVIALTVFHSYVWGPKLTALSQSSQGSEYQRTMQTLVLWGRVNLTLSLAIIFCASLLRFSPF